MGGIARPFGPGRVKKKIKVIPLDITKWLITVSLFWAMEWRFWDKPSPESPFLEWGVGSPESGVGEGFYLNTHSYSYREQLLIQQALFVLAHWLGRSAGGGGSLAPYCVIYIDMVSIINCILDLNQYLFLNL